MSLEFYEVCLQGSDCEGTASAPLKLHSRGPASASTRLHPLSQIPLGLATRHFVAMQVFSRRTAGALQAAARRQGYSTATSGYAATAENLRINKDTKVIYQGFTGKQGRCVNRNVKLALASANSRKVSTPSRPLIMVFNTLTYGTEHGIDWVQEPMSSVVQIQRKPERHIWESQCLPKSAMLSKRRGHLHPRSSSREEHSRILPKFYAASMRLRQSLTKYQTATGRRRYRGSYRSRNAPCRLHYRRNSPA